MGECSANDDSCLDEYLMEDDFDEAELLAEIEREREEEEKIRLEAEAAAALNPQLRSTSALSSYQEEIITTGSGVAIAILWVLGILFLIRGLQLIYSVLTKMSALGEISSVLSEAKSIAAHKMDEFIFNNSSDSQNYQISYNAPFERKAEFEEIVETDPHNKPLIKSLLILRAKELLKRGMILDRDRTGMFKSFQMDMVPMEVWNDFNNASTALDSEAKLVNFESQRHQLTYGKHGPNIFLFVSELLESEKKRRINLEGLAKNAKRRKFTKLFKSKNKKS